MTVHNRLCFRSSYFLSFFLSFFVSSHCPSSRRCLGSLIVSTIKPDYSKSANGSLKIPEPLAQNGVQNPGCPASSESE